MVVSIIGSCRESPDTLMMKGMRRTRGARVARSCGRRGDVLIIGMVNQAGMKKKSVNGRIISIVAESAPDTLIRPSPAVKIQNRKYTAGMREMVEVRIYFLLGWADLTYLTAPRAGNRKNIRVMKKKTKARMGESGIVMFPWASAGMEVTEATNQMMRERSGIK